MTAQLRLFPEGEDRTLVEASGIITPFVFATEYLSSKEAYEKAVRADPNKTEKALEWCSRALGKSDETLGVLRLLPETVTEYYPEDFLPQNWVLSAEEIQHRRRIYQIEMILKDGSRKKVMIKEPKRGLWYGHGNGDWLSGISQPHIHGKPSEDELKDLQKLRDFGIQTEKPLGYFEEGLEQWLYTEFLEGEAPLEVLADEERREDLLKADARLLARLSKARMKHWGFFSREFDDKLYVDGEMVLIDTDETSDVFNSRDYGKYFRENPQKLPLYYRDWLKDTLSSYLFFKIVTEDELEFYATEFFREREESLEDLKEILEDIDPERVTEESYIALVSDSL